MRARSLLALGACVAAWLLGGSAGTARADEPLIFIVNAGNPASSLSAAELADLFLKKQRHWPDGSSVRFIDRKEGSQERKAFLRQILGKTARELDLYWIGQKLYSGESAPMQVGSDSMVISLVGSLKGAVGYVRGPVSEAPGIKKIEVSGASP